MVRCKIRMEGRKGKSVEEGRGGEYTIKQSIEKGTPKALGLKREDG